MNSSEQIAFFEKQVGRSQMGMAAARQNSDYQLAAFNSWAALKSRFMQGLIAWRSGDNPTGYLNQALARFAEDWQALQEIGGESAKLSSTGYEQVLFIAYLIGQPPPFSVQSHDAEGLQCDRMLDAVLGLWLFDGWDAPVWETGMRKLKRKGSKLAVETYAFYRQMTLATEKELLQLAVTADELFLRRKKDDFFAGGVQTSGGGPDNDFTVDYQFAALAKDLRAAV